MATEAEAIRAMREGHARAAERKLELMRTEGPEPGVAARECFAALDALMEAGLWPGPRDPLSERGVAEVRARWAKIGQRARAARGL
ncbi:MAG: hypothetical protein U0414_43350 [Polyangiaceae bacterium]